MPRQRQVEAAARAAKVARVARVARRAKAVKLVNPEFRAAGVETRDFRLYESSIQKRPRPVKERLPLARPTLHIPFSTSTRDGTVVPLEGTPSLNLDSV